MIAEPALRSLDAIHVASAIDAAPLDALVSYDIGQSVVARSANDGPRHSRALPGQTASGG